MPGTSAAGVVADLTGEAGAEAAVAAALELGGSLDVLVNNAGMVSTAAGGDYLEGDLLGTPPRALGGIPGPQPRHRLPHDPGRPAAPAGERSRSGRHGHLGDRRRHGDARRSRLCRSEGRAGRSHPGARGRRGGARPHRERGGPGVDRDGLADAGRGARGAARPRSAAREPPRRSPPPSCSSRAPARPTSTARCSSSTAATRSPRSASSPDGRERMGRAARRTHHG